MDVDFKKILRGDLEELHWWWAQIYRVRRSSEDVLFGLQIYGPLRKKAWFQRYVLPVYRFCLLLHDARLWVAFRTTRRRCWTVPTGLTPGYYDCDTLMLYGCMGLLRRYIELECGGREPAAGAHPYETEAYAIWKWWTVERPAAKQRCRPLIRSSNGNATLSAEAQAEWRRARQDLMAADDAMLLRLMAIRRSLWT